MLREIFLLWVWFVYSVFIKTTPQWQSDLFLIESIPGLRHGPKKSNSSANSTIIAFNAKNVESYKKWTDVLEDFLAAYREPGLVPGRSENVIICDYERPPWENRVCDVDLRAFYRCNQENNFNYHESTPCVFITLNKIYDLKPEFYNDTNKLPEEMPSDLKEHILDLNARNSELLNTIWLSCEGESPADEENIGPIQYIPRRGFPGYFYINTNVEGYLSPLVAIYFEKPKTGVLINIECRAWAPNIEYNREEGRGFVHFVLLIE